MKKAILSLLALPLLFSCSSEENESSGKTGRVPLQIEFDGITRAAITGTTLPNESQLGVFAFTKSNSPYGTIVEDGDNNRVVYNDGKCEFNKLIFIPEGGSLYTWAYYPYDVNQSKTMLSDGWWLDASQQKDYLVSSFSQYASESNPTIKLVLRHLMSRIHVTLKKAENNTKDYYYKEMYLKNAYKTGRYIMNSGSISLDNTTTTLYGYTTNNNSSLQDGKVVEFDFLVLPTTSNYSMDIELPNSYPELKASLQPRKYVAGEQYDVTLTINHLGELEVGEWTIVPWDSNTQEGLDVWKDNKTIEMIVPKPLY